jgi:hypothetical protein
MKKNRFAIIILLDIFMLALFSQPILAEVANQTTVTATSGTNTLTPTKTSGTPSSTFTPSSTPSNTPTTTLVPVPVITLIFPVSTNTPVATITPATNFINGTPTPLNTASTAQLSPRIKVLTIILVLLWLFLAGYLIIYIRQFR